ncbi:MAG: 1-acyl-sn-glycerol-3-phosphate acyltransferase [Lachnospiraceae bacterium]|nr:1-acyl-sn-glycerol-3-phosphate acyltransferase [Lachnospiraceae bacterium]
MKIKVTELDYDKVISEKKYHHIRPVKQSKLLRKLFYLASIKELKDVDFTCTLEGMEEIAGDAPCLFLMNHSSFTDLQITAKLLKDRQYHIICTNDGLVGKEGIMRRVGCIPTRKFIQDVELVRDMKYAVDKLGSSILMFPEASYTFDGTATPLPDSLGKCVKLLGIPVVMIKTSGAFLRDPLYNLLQKRDVKVSAEVKILLNKDAIKKTPVNEINEILRDAFTFDHFREQFENGIVVDEKFRADGLHRALYKCPECHKEGKMEGKGIYIRCNSCNKEYELLPSGKLTARSGDTKFEYVTDWYAWQRREVMEEIDENRYSMDFDCDIYMLSDLKSIYKVGEGHLHHDSNGFVLDGCENRLHYTQKPSASYSLYADYYWYELGDMICIGDTKCQYYCFPKDQKGAIVAKARLATEEMFKKMR